MSSFINIQSGVESNLQRAVAYVGPVSVAVDADNKAFRVSRGREGPSQNTFFLPLFLCVWAWIPLYIS